MKKLLVAGLLLVGACVIQASSAQTTVRDRGSYDLQCNRNQVRVASVGGTTYEAQGCGRRQVYTCNSDGSTCVRDGNGLPPEPPPPPPVQQSTSLRR